MKKLALMLMVVAVAGCSSDKPKVDPMVAACPERVVLVVQANQAFFERVANGETSAKGLKGLKGLKRKATLTRGGESMDVAFYLTGIPGCAWMMSAESLTPVVTKGGEIVAVGTIAAKDLMAKGWSLKEAAWPWQRYDFGYLPQK